MVEQNIHKGHRERLRKRILSAADNEVPEHELLEALLFYCIPRSNTNGVAHRLIKTFGSLSRVLSAEPAELIAVRGIGTAAAEYLAIVGKCVRLSQKIEPCDVVYSFGTNRTYDYLHELFNGIEGERFYMLYLDGRHVVRRVELIFEGSLENVEVEVGSIVKRALLQENKYCVCVHNHPSGQLRASHADKETVRKLELALTLVGLELCDSVIVTQEGQYSMKSDTVSGI